ncbi:PEPxxWA-CTERM sorting domain-containing protein [Qipengyuania sp.]|uniref:PEPxxWA-CTERM sorting domain-containing protein n=1 Tax=Qipengyuania sp. TaxID=2004515 RepID=UPI0035C859AF
MNKLIALPILTLASSPALAATLAFQVQWESYNGYALSPPFSSEFSFNTNWNGTSDGNFELRTSWHDGTSDYEIGNLTVADGIITSLGKFFSDPGSCNCYDYFSYGSGLYDLGYIRMQSVATYRYQDWEGVYSNAEYSTRLAPVATLDGNPVDVLYYPKLGGTGFVPEPSTWAFFILGFGAIGGAMRRRQSATFAFARS